MKILCWTDGFWPRVGGIETQTLQCIVGMQKRGHQYIVITQKDRSDWRSEEIHQDILIKRFDFNAIIEKRDLTIIRSVQESLEKILREFQPDLIHLNAAVGGSAFAFLLCRQMFRIPIVMTFHDRYLHENHFPPLITKLISSVDQVCCISSWLFSELKKYLPPLKNNLKLIYYGLSLSNQTPLPLSFEPPTLLLLGRLVPEKGFDTAIRAFSLLRKNGSRANLLIAGGGPERLFLETLVDQLKLKDCVQFTGEITRDKIPSIINQATLLIVPSYSESFGLVALEAMEMQRPVIASTIGGLQEIVIDQQTGLLVPPFDPFTLCNAIETLLQCPEKAMQMGIRGRKKLIDTFTLEKNLDQYETLFYETLSQCHHNRL